MLAYKKTNFLKKFTLTGEAGVFKNFSLILDWEHLLAKNQRFWPIFETGTGPYLKRHNIQQFRGL